MEPIPLSLEDCMQNFDVDYYCKKVGIDNKNADFHFQNVGYRDGVCPYSIFDLTSQLASLCLGTKSFVGFGVNLIRFKEVSFGVGASAYYLQQQLESLHIPLTIIHLSVGSHISISDVLDDKLLYPINIIALNPGQLIYVYRDEKFSKLMKNRYNIGYWFWECEFVPEPHRSAFKLVNEAWVVSKFCSDLFLSCSDIPVLTFEVVPGPLSKEFNCLTNPPDLNITNKYKIDRFTFLYVFDFGSSSIRKNPKAAIDAFVDTFGNCRNKTKVQLLLKTQKITTDANSPIRKEYEELLSYIQQKTRTVNTEAKINLVSDTVSREELIGLMRSCHCYVSLHCSEGQGLGIIDAMKLGLPIIATGYSAPTDFLNSDNSILVKYNKVNVSDIIHYSACWKSKWAAVDIHDAAFAMNKIYHDHNHRSKIIAGALNTWSVERYTDACDRIFKRLEHIYLKSQYPNDTFSTDSPSSVLIKVLKEEKEYIVDWITYQHSMYPLVSLTEEQLKNWYWISGIRDKNWITCRSTLRKRLCELLVKNGYKFNTEFYIRVYSLDRTKDAYQYYITEGYKLGHIYVLNQD